MVKGRNEPCKVINIAEILAALHEQDLEEISRELYENTMKLFFSFSRINDGESDALAI
jgi:Tat protein secretion system quality control protein TatD with DNase activity